MPPHLNGSTIIAIKSTVPVGTSRDIERRLRQLRPDVDRLLQPGVLARRVAIRDFTHPDRVLIGCDDGRGREVMRRLYQLLALRNAPIVFVSPEPAAVRATRRWASSASRSSPILTTCVKLRAW